jgi:hypothetical protein
MNAIGLTLPKRIWATMFLFAFVFAQATSPVTSVRADDDGKQFTKYKAVITPGKIPQLLEEITGQGIVAQSGSDLNPAAFSQWYTLYSEDWETNSLPGAAGWSIEDNSSTDQVWATTSSNTYSGTGAIAATAGGGNGFGNGTPTYANGVSTSAQYFSISLLGFADAQLEFYYNLDTEYNADFFCYAVYSNGDAIQTSECVTGETFGWVRENISLKDHVGRNDIYIEFLFFSDDENDDYPGVFVDDIKVLYSLTAEFTSNKTHDGWLLESKKGSNKGGTMNAKEKYLRVGDDAQNRAYRSVLSFDTSSLPDGSVIKNAWIELNFAPSVGDPFSIARLNTDIRSSTFGATGLELTDFQRAASANMVRGKYNILYATKVKVSIDSTAALLYINKTGITQFRLRLEKKTNNNSTADYWIFFSANGPASKAPKLYVQYAP